MKANCKKCFKQNTKTKNLRTANLSDFDAAGKERIREQVLAAMGTCTINNATSVASSITRLVW